MTPDHIRDRFLAVIKTRWTQGPLKAAFQHRMLHRSWVLIKRRTRLIATAVATLAKKAGNALLRALKALYAGIKKAGLPVVVVASHIGSAIRATLTWVKEKLSRLRTRHRLFIATSVSYRDALAGAMALAAALVGIRKEIATLLGMAISSLQRFFAQRVFIDDIDEEDGDDGLQPTWRPRPNW